MNLLFFSSHYAGEFVVLRVRIVFGCLLRLQLDCPVYTSGQRQNLRIAERMRCAECSVIFNVYKYGFEREICTVPRMPTILKLYVGPLTLRLSLLFCVMEHLLLQILALNYCVTLCVA
jgi:hypothetical protein